MLGEVLIEGRDVLPRFYGGGGLVYCFQCDLVVYRRKSFSYGLKTHQGYETKNRNKYRKTT